MQEPLNRSDYEYILSSLKYARYAHEESQYASKELKRQQMAYMDHMEEKLRALRDEVEQKNMPVNEPQEY